MSKTLWIKTTKLQGHSQSIGQASREKSFNVRAIEPIASVSEPIASNPAYKIKMTGVRADQLAAAK